MVRFVLHRLLLLVPMVFLALTVTFVMVQMAPAGVVCRFKINSRVTVWASTGRSSQADKQSGTIESSAAVPTGCVSFGSDSVGEGLGGSAAGWTGRNSSIADFLSKL